MKAVVSSEGELVIPGSLLKRYGLRAGATVVLEAREGEIALRPEAAQAQAQASLVRLGDDVLLEAPTGAPPMTPETVKELLEDWP